MSSNVISCMPSAVSRKITSVAISEVDAAVPSGAPGSVAAQTFSPAKQQEHHADQGGAQQPGLPGQQAMRDRRRRSSLRRSEGSPARTRIPGRAPRAQARTRWRPAAAGGVVAVLQPGRPPVGIRRDDEQQSGQDAEELREAESHRGDLWVPPRLCRQEERRRQHAPAPDPPEDVGLAAGRRRAGTAASRRRASRRSRAGAD